MRLIDIKKVLAGKFISRYDVTYETRDGGRKVYEMISRNPELATHKDLQGRPADAVVIVAQDGSGQKILLNKEYRLAVGDWVYNFPAGMIDPGETPEEAAARELREETGLTLYEINDLMNTSYSAVGFSNETNVTVIGKAGGQFGRSTSVAEEIQAGWYDKEQVRTLLKTEKFAARTQMFCYMWCLDDRER